MTHLAIRLISMAFSVLIIMEQTKSWFSKSRVEMFSDGVFAIIITILVLELKVPRLAASNSTKELATALLLIVPKFFSWVISFFMICVVWVNHHRLFESITHITYKIFWYNAYLLLWCAFIPFPTAMVGDYPGNKLSLFIFGIVLSLMGLGFVFLRNTILREHLLIQRISENDFKKDNIKSFFFGCVLYFAGALIAWLNPFISLIIYALVPFYFIFLNIRTGKELVKPGKE